MKHARFIYILGDLHGEFGAFNTFFNTQIRMNSALKTYSHEWRKAGDDFQIIILQCGDFAWFWPLCDSRGKIKTEIDWYGGNVPIYWTGGNHEDWDALDSLGTGMTEIDKGVYYCPFGSTLELSPETTILFAGGAESSDKDWRIEEMKRGAPKIWWEQEGISNADLARLASVPKADWVISHTCPISFDIGSHMRWSGHANEPSRLKLEQVLVKYEPVQWYFGHFHHHMKGKVDNCHWECLGNIRSSTKFWTWDFLDWDD